MVRRTSSSVYWHPCRRSASPVTRRISRGLDKGMKGVSLCAAPATPPRPRLSSPRPLTPAAPCGSPLFEPDIPQNTGTILRLAACLGVEAHLIEPAGFPTSDRAFRRAGMDYLDHVTIERHASWDDFERWRVAQSFASFCSPPRRHQATWIIAMRRATSCCSAANRLAYPASCTMPRTFACASPCDPACARSTWR